MTIQYVGNEKYETYLESGKRVELSIQDINDLHTFIPRGTWVNETIGYAAGTMLEMSEIITSFTEQIEAKITDEILAEFEAKIGVFENSQNEVKRGQKFGEKLSFLIQALNDADENLKTCLDRHY